MNNLARGGIVLILMSLFVVFIYAQARSEASPAIANDSHKEVKDVVNTEIASITTSPTPDDNKKLVTKTVLTTKSTASTTASAGGRSLGSFTATAYCLQGRTAMGHGVRRGIVAADPRVLKLGSRITINGAGYSGSYLVSDTGGAVRGRKLDIWVPSCSEARRFGRRTVSVFVN